MPDHHTPCGIELPQVFFDGPTDMEHIRRFAMQAETLGYDSLWLQERIIGDFTMLEPVTLLSYVAGITTKLKLGTSVILLPLRNPLQLAKAYSSLDVMSGGRSVLGVGLGGGHLGSHEDVFGYSREGRVTRFTEAVQIMKLLWTEPTASFQGRYWSFKEISMEPKPLQKPHLPIIFGGHHDNALRRAVKSANGWMGAGSSSSASFIREAARIRIFLDQAQRDPASFHFAKRVYLAVDKDKARGEKRIREWFARRYKNADLGPKVSIWGSSAECAEKIQEIIHAGAQHIVFNPMFDEMEHLEICAKEIMPHL
ncbi:MAG TPA: LLM class flavin-dependent oxidoreductase [Candidatus Binatia bacterium]|jgi:probable F420-dependent oxidoreductase|nr:LLM class flavin-dependent oxidoreductase [Candidatus Binatia bacterium]